MSKEEGGSGGGWRHLLAGQHTKYTPTQGQILRLRVTSVGPEVRDVRVGMTIHLDPTAAEDRMFKWEGRQMASVPEKFFNWKTSQGLLFGVYEVE